MKNNNTTPYILLQLAKSGYTVISGSNRNEHGLPYFFRHNVSGEVICLNPDGKTYRPMGELIEVRFK